MTLCEKLTDKYIWLMLAVYPLFLGFRGYARLTDSKYIFFAAASFLWLAALIALCLLRGERPKARLKAVHWAVLAFLAVCLLSTLCSLHRAEALLGSARYGGLLTLSLYCGIFFGVSLFARPRREYAFAIGLSAAVCCAVAVLQLCGSGVLYPNDFNFFDGNIRYSGIFLGTIGNAGPLNAYLCLAVVVCAGAYIIGDERYDALLVLPAALGVFVMKCSGVAAGAVALAAAALVLPPLLVNSMHRLFRLCRCACALCAALGFSMWLSFAPDGVSLSRNAASLALFLSAAALLAAPVVLRRYDFSAKALLRFFLCLDVILILAALLMLWFYPFASGTPHELSEALHGRISDDFGSSRIRIWRETLLLFTERPLLGGGPDTLSLRLDLHFSRFVPETGESVSSFIDNAHNAYLGYLINIGLLGLLSYLAVICLTAAELLKKKFRDFRAVMFVGLAAAWTEAFFGLDLFLTNPMFFIFWGLFFGKENACPCVDGQADALMHTEL